MSDRQQDGDDIARHYVFISVAVPATNDGRIVSVTHDAVNA